MPFVGRVSVAPPGFAFKSTTRSPIYEECNVLPSGQRHTVDGLSAVEQLVCDIAAERWRNGKRVLIACEDEQQAIRLDEALWARPPESFVPHNLAGEGREAARRWRLPGRKSATAARGIF
jgi:hypothetical protein